MHLVRNNLGRAHLVDILHPPEASLVGIRDSCQAVTNLPEIVRVPTAALTAVKPAMILARLTGRKQGGNKNRCAGVR